ncbi:hypothetical protein LZC95_43300 [Pendulispora brunnea]|uniref:Uncharacterized protein n=1 Tax=Pendulispora brunnea TaxID=2905690 RepID=A0ABZ2K3J8_9BACT
MSTALTRLPGSPHGVRVAALLAATRHVHLRLAADLPAPSGYVRGVPAVDMWTATGAPVPTAVDCRMEEWRRGGVEFAICDIASFGFERLVDAVYFPLFVRCSYCTTDADFSMNVPTLRRLATSDVLLTIASVRGVEIAAALFQPTLRTPFERYSAEDLVPDGLDMVVSATQDPHLSDAFFYASLQMLEAHGFANVRVRRSPWIASRTARYWHRDLLRADRLAWEERLPADWFSWQPSALAPDEGLVSFYVDDRGLHARVIGAVDGHLLGCASRIEELLAWSSARQAEVR